MGPPLPERRVIVMSAGMQNALANSVIHTFDLQLAKRSGNDQVLANAFSCWISATILDDAPLGTKAYGLHRRSMNSKDLGHTEQTISFARLPGKEEDYCTILLDRPSPG
jgi:hypothetical protein